MRLFRNRLAAILEAEDGVRNRGEHDDADDARNCKDGFLQIIDLLCIRAFWLPRVLRRILCTARKERNGRDTRSSDDETAH
ncbi:MAG: hypothetical protein EBQ88_03735 [Betaproteobacteria bacterium]|nr:hypothetical protein [Betaproteobacteria bacterium]